VVKRVELVHSKVEHAGPSLLCPVLPLVPVLAVSSARLVVAHVRAFVPLTQADTVHVQTAVIDRQTEFSSVDVTDHAHAAGDRRLLARADVRRPVREWQVQGSLGESEVEVIVESNAVRAFHEVGPVREGREPVVDGDVRAFAFADAGDVANLVVSTEVAVAQAS